jgi:hypothetical protein
MIFLKGIGNGMEFCIKTNERTISALLMFIFNTNCTSVKITGKEWDDNIYEGKSYEIHTKESIGDLQKILFREYAYLNKN